MGCEKSLTQRIRARLVFESLELNIKGWGRSKLLPGFLPSIISHRTNENPEKTLHSLLRLRRVSAGERFPETTLCLFPAVHDFHGRARTYQTVGPLSREPLSHHSMISLVDAKRWTCQHVIRTTTYTGTTSSHSSTPNRDTACSARCSCVQNPESALRSCRAWKSPWQATHRPTDQVKLLYIEVDVYSILGLLSTQVPTVMVAAMNRWSSSFPSPRSNKCRWCLGAWIWHARPPRPRNMPASTTIRLMCTTHQECVQSGKK